MAKHDLTAQRVRELFLYSPESGALIWNQKRGRCAAGTMAGYVHHSGYRMVRVDGFMYQAHRIIWLYVHGSFPAQYIDHINQDRLDNRLENLREASPSENQQNRRATRRADGTEILLGTSKFTHSNSWRAHISVDGKRIHLGTFKTAEDAHLAYLQAKRNLHPAGTM